eukprot:9887799-Alexandrium_andersonii.AAC.1
MLRWPTSWLTRQVCGLPRRTSNASARSVMRAPSGFLNRPDTVFGFHPGPTETNAEGLPARRRGGRPSSELRKARC